FHCQMTALLRRVCGRDARGPSTSLDWLPKTERQEAFRPPAWCLLPTAYSFTFPFPNSRCIRVVPLSEYRWPDPELEVSSSRSRYRLPAVGGGRRALVRLSFLPGIQPKAPGWQNSYPSRSPDALQL